MIKFPQWARLHKFWRLLPKFNQFADTGERFKGPGFVIVYRHRLSSQYSSSRTTGQKRKKARDVEDSDEVSALSYGLDL
jgi:hypothetical protein